MGYIIPIYSKNPQFIGLPEFYDKAKGCRIKINSKWFYDFSVMGASACILGYADKYVNHYVKKCINNGNWSSLNSRYMKKLTDLLLNIHPEYDTVRYCKGGGEALDLAFRLAITNKKAQNKLGFLQCGYNGWIIKNENWCIPHINTLDDILTIKDRPQVFIFELVRHYYPSSEAIEKLKEWQEQGTILICDEVTTGFRFRCGGVYKNFGLIPDMIVYAKGMSNGYPISCIIGKKEIIESVLWVSSTYWSDAIGFCAAYHTIKKLQKCNYKLLEKLGITVIKIWETCARTHGIEIKIGGVPNIANFEFNEPNISKLEDNVLLKQKKEYNLLLKNLFIEKMQEQGILALDQFYPSFAHNAKSFGAYVRACDNVFGFIKRHLDDPEKFIKNKIKELNK